MELVHGIGPGPGPGPGPYTSDALVIRSLSSQRGKCSCDVFLDRAIDVVC